MDDDVATGATRDAVLAMLPMQCRPVHWVALCELDRDATGPRVDLADCRDFLVGARESGLVVALPSGRLARAPYLLPYVHPSARTSVPPSRALAFSRRVWLLNQQFFARLDPPVRLREANAAFQTLAAALGFGPEAPLQHVCEWHLDRLPRG